MSTTIKEKLEGALEAVSEKTPDIVKDNKGAIIGAVIGLLFTNNEKAKSAVLGAIAGSLIGDDKNGK